jgi:hypothetical protein
VQRSAPKTKSQVPETKASFGLARPLRSTLDPPHRTFSLAHISSGTHNLSEEPEVAYLYYDDPLLVTMSNNPEERNKDSRKAAENNIEQQAEPPLDKTDPTEPVRVGGAKEGKGTSTQSI